LININPGKFSDSSSPTSSVSAKGAKKFKIIKYYNNVADSNLSKSSGYDYLSTSNKNLNTTTGLTFLTYEQFANRVDNESKKFFKTSQPNLSMNINGNNIDFGSNS
jgi:hypothetical protein